MNAQLCSGKMANENVVLFTLLQVLPAGLAARALLFDWPIVLGEDSHWEKVSPGFFDAPGEWRRARMVLRHSLGQGLLKGKGKPTGCSCPTLS